LPDLSGEFVVTEAMGVSGGEGGDRSCKAGRISSAITAIEPAKPTATAPPTQSQAEGLRRCDSPRTGRAGSRSPLVPIAGPLSRP
jgi:hypothetical protein